MTRHRLIVVLFFPMLCFAGTSVQMPHSISYKQLLHVLPKTLKESERRRGDAEGEWACYLNFSDYLEGGMPTALVLVDSKQIVHSFSYAFHYRWDKKPDVDRQKSVDLIVNTLRLIYPKWQDSTQWVQNAVDSVWKTGETMEHLQDGVAVISIKRDFSQYGISPYDHLECEIQLP